MADALKITDEVRERIMADPAGILEDRDLMRVLIAANERMMGGNIIDMRGIAMDRLESRLDRLEDTHRSVIAAAYENLAGTNQVHRAILKLLDPAGFEDFLRSLGGDVAEILRVDRLRLVLETVHGTREPSLRRLGDVLHVAKPGFVASYMADRAGVAPRPILLRQCQPTSEALYGEAAGWIRSEAMMRLDLGDGRLPGMLVMGSEDPHQFKPAQGTDLLAFFAGVFERAMRRWLT